MIIMVLNDSPIMSWFLNMFNRFQSVLSQVSWRSGSMSAKAGITVTGAAKGTQCATSSDYVVTSTHIIYCHTLSYIIRSSSYAIHTLFGGPRELECFDCWTLKCQNQVCEERRNGVSTVSYDVVKCNMSRYPNMHYEYHVLEWLINWYISDRWKNNLAGPAMSSLRAQCTCCLFASLLFRTEDPRKSGEIIKKTLFR